MIGIMLVSVLHRFQEVWWLGLRKPEDFGLREQFIWNKIQVLSNLCVQLDAEEAQSKIEELRDQEYNEKRSALLTQNDIEMNELLEQRKEHLRDFERKWNAHEVELVQSSQADLEALE